MKGDGRNWQEAGGRRQEGRKHDEKWQEAEERLPGSRLEESMRQEGRRAGTGQEEE